MQLVIRSQEACESMQGVVLHMGGKSGGLPVLQVGHYLAAMQRYKSESDLTQHSLSDFKSEGH